MAVCAADRALTWMMAFGYLPLLTHRLTYVADSPTDLPKSFEAALTEIEAIVERMEGRQLTLQESLDVHRRGAELLRYCQAALQDAEQQVKILEDDLLQTFSGANDNAA